MGVRIFYGSKENIPLRHLQAAESLAVDAVVAVDGDDILCSIDAMAAVRDGMLRGEKYVSTSGLPLGMNAFGYRRDFLAASVAGNEHKTLETGWGYIFDPSRLANQSLDLGLDAPERLRFTLDYPEDYEFFKAIVEHFGDEIFTAKDKGIVSCVLAQGLQRLTDPVSQKYWENFRSVQADEMRRG
jgi:spore coat polysaccharide biosynthesis protein SpsF (cytidylyltransferase family)